MKTREGKADTPTPSDESETPKYDHAMASVSAYCEMAEREISKMTNLDEVLEFIRLLEKATIQLVGIRKRGERQAKKASRQLALASLERELRPTKHKRGG